MNRVVFGDTLLLRRGLLFMAESFHDGQPAAFAPNGDASQLLDYSMLWAQSLQDYLELTDDRAFVAQVYPALQELMAYLASRRNLATGLLDIAPGHWSRTALIDWAGAASRSGQSAALNALYYATLADAADVAAQLEHADEAARWRQQANAVRQQMNELLYLDDQGDDQGRYAASILAGVVVTPTTHAQAWPLAYGVPPPQQVARVAAAMLGSFHVQIFGMFWVLEGLGKASRVADAVELILEQYGPLLDQGATTLWEHWDSNQRYQASLAHSWGGAPTWFLSTYVLGARQRGRNSWLVQPSFAGVEWAEGAVPLAEGDLEVAWQQPSCAERHLTVNAPKGSNGEIHLTAAQVTTLRLNGAIVWENGACLSSAVQLQEDAIRVASSGGVEQLDITLTCR